jgi:hypothetical protein
MKALEFIKKYIYGEVIKLDDLNYFLHFSGNELNQEEFDNLINIKSVNIIFP